MRAPSPENAVLACFSLTMRQPTTSAIRNKRRTRGDRANSPPHSRRSLFWQNRAAPCYRARLVYASAIRARSCRRQRHPPPFSTTAGNALTSPTHPHQSCPDVFADEGWRATSRARSPPSRAGYRAPFANSALRESSTPPESAQFPDVPSQTLAAALKLWLSFSYQLRQSIVSNENNQQAFWTNFQIQPRPSGSVRLGNLNPIPLPPAS